ncbi:chaplin ChpH [Kitasatospora putterlickiae]|uniref:Chaplin ChpH n=1 Tax=Kitasatospora putterlickiae TaxID=221725 RepID=A0ABN1YAQ6_9ACTN
MSIKKTAAVGAAVVGIVAAGAGTALASSGAEGVAANSPGVVSGNQIQVPLHIPVNVCGNTIDIVGILNPAFGNTCVNNG